MHGLFIYRLLAPAGPASHHGGEEGQPSRAQPVLFISYSFLRVQTNVLDARVIHGTDEKAWLRGVASRVATRCELSWC